MRYNRRNILMFTMIAGLIPATAAQAVYTGLSVERYATVMAGGVQQDVFRVYANFSNPNDRFVFAWGDEQGGLPAVVQNRNADDSDFGLGFFNMPGGVTAPTLEQIANNADAQWDTFATIGVSIADQAAPYGDWTLPILDFHEIQGTNWVLVNGGWLLPPTFDHDKNPNTPEIPPPQSLAGFLGDGDPLNRVLLLQLTVRAGENVRGSINLVTFHPYPGGSAGAVYGQTFNSIPAPSALAVMACGILWTGRRRREALQFNWRS